MSLRSAWTTMADEEDDAVGEHVFGGPPALLSAAPFDHLAWRLHPHVHPHGVKKSMFCRWIMVIVDGNDDRRRQVRPRLLG
jgi:hypothetical protein